MRQFDVFTALESGTASIDTEFKSARGGMPGSFGEPDTSMTNTQGGTIVLGVAEKATGWVWEGVSYAARLCTVLSWQLDDRYKVSMEYLKTLPIRLVPGWPGRLRELSRLTDSREIPSLSSAVGAMATRPPHPCTSPFPRRPDRCRAGMWCHAALWPPWRTFVGAAARLPVQL